MTPDGIIHKSYIYETGGLQEGENPLHIISPKFFKEKLEMLNLPGVSFKEIEYRPTGSPYYDRVPKYNGMSCSGLKVSVVDRKLVMFFSKLL